MKVKYIYSACLEINCDNFIILTDPWFTEGAYDGSWYQFPKIDPFDFIVKPDLIYISHIHPDHYDSIFLKKLIAKFGDIKILIPNISPNYLLTKGKSDGLKLHPTRHFKNEKVELFIEENDTGSIADIDSALILKDLRTGNILLNLNDCIFNQLHVDKLNSIIDDIGTIDLLAVGYTGAGPYPQTYISLENEKDLLVAEADKKKNKFLRRYKEYTKVFNAKYNLPFAGEYILGGKLHYLNEYRGIADAYEVKSMDNNALVLLNGGEIDLENDQVSEERKEPYDPMEINERINSLKNALYDYEIEIQIPFSKINFLRLLKVASANARTKVQINYNYNLIFSILDKNNKVQQRFDLSMLDNSISEIGIDHPLTYREYSEIIIDYRYLYGLLTSIYHWNNAEVGSQYFTRRRPLNNFRREVQNYLSFMSSV